MISLSSHTLIPSCTHPPMCPCSALWAKIYLKTIPMRKHTQPHFAYGQDRGERVWAICSKMKMGSLWQSWKKIPHHYSPSRVWPHITPSLTPTVGWCSAVLQRPPHHPTGLQAGADLGIPRVALGVTSNSHGSAMTNEHGLRSTSCRGGSTAAVLGTAGCPRSRMTSPLLAILGYCPAFEAGRKIASSTAAPFSTASPLLLTWVTNITDQVTQNANISG